jgi:hypothetical protein
MARPGTISNTSAVEVSIQAVTPVSICTPSDAMTEPAPKRSNTPDAITLLLNSPFIRFHIDYLLLSIIWGKYIIK